MGKVIELKRQTKENILKSIEQNEMQRKKEIAHLLIDYCEGDFALVFKTKDIEHILDNVPKKDFVVALSDINKRKIGHEDYFFSNFSSRQYFDLNC